MNWTREQRAAITADNDTVLVSAAAGSGKTAVLVERVTRLIREGGDISRMLIVTFTRAAAAEMRERITAALQKERSDPHVYRQSLRVGLAQISTIHTFCLRVIHEHFEVLGLDPMAGTADDTQQKQLMARALAEGMEEVCENPTEEEAMLFACYPIDTIADMIERLRSFLLSLPDPWGWAEEKLIPWEGKLTDHPAFAVLMKQCGLRLQGARALLRTCFDTLLLPGCPLRYEAAVRDDEQVLEGLILKAERGELRGGSVSFTALPRGKKADAAEDDPEVTELFKSRRALFKDAVQEALSLLPADEKGTLDDDREGLRLARGLYQTLRAVQARYDALKNERNLLDYSDLEHFCVKALKNEEVRKAVAGSFDALFIDEYQDVSAIQESIIQAVHEGNTLFLVGDVKQSIYGFRQADPSLFLHKYDTFSPDEGALHRKILLQNNFRSDKNVLDAVNQVFTHAMRRGATEIDYDEEAMLRPGPDARPGPYVDVHLLEKRDPETGELLRVTGAAGLEAEAIARQIKEMVGKAEIHDRGEARPVKYRDIVILMRDAAGSAAVFSATLQARGIPVYSDADSLYYELPEVSDTLHILELLDNPFQDFPLLGALRSPCFGFSSEELSGIRLLNRQGSVPFHEVFRQMAGEDHQLGRRCRKAIETLDRWRTLSRVLRTEDLVRLVMDESGIYMRAGAEEDGDARQANLRLLAERASEADRLTDFLSQAHKARTADDSRTAKTLSDQEDVVRIMTMHKSKGLEFPVVFLARLGKAFRSAGTDPVRMDRDLGIALPMIDEEARVQRTTLTQKAVTAAMDARRLAEEARVLYVAMTRAREKLILYAAPAYPEKSREVWRLPEGDVAAANAGCMIDWVMQALSPAQDGESGAPFQAANGALFRVWHDDAEELRSETSAQTPFMPAAETGPYSERTERLLSRTLPAPRPLKVSVSAIAKKRQTEEDQEETPETKRRPETDMPEDRPRFLIEKRMTAAERGSAVHKALGLLPYEKLEGSVTPGKISALLDGLEDERKLTHAEREALRPEDLARFFNSSLGQRALASPRVQREWPFNLIADGETVVQGVLDLCFEENGSWVLVDYKTDFVTGMDTLLSRYTSQLNWYARALETLTDKPVREALLYSVRLGDFIEVPREKTETEKP